MTDAAGKGVAKASIRRPDNLRGAGSYSSGVAPLSWRWPPWLSQLERLALLPIKNNLSSPGHSGTDLNGPPPECMR